MKMCAALAVRGHEVILVAKAGKPIADVDDHAFFNVPPTFTIEKLARPGRRGGGVLYSASVLRELVRHRCWADLVYCRDPLGALAATALGMPVVLEAHGVPETAWLRRIFHRVTSSRWSRGVVAITEALRRDLLAAGIQSSIVVAPDACDPPTSAVRTTMSSPPRIGYVGNLYAGRGIETIVALASAMPECQFVVVGGQPADVLRWQAKSLPNNLELLGFRPQRELPEHYASFDVVLMPHAATGVVGASGGQDISRWTSPMKMFEYMAAGVAIVASDLPVIREVLRDGENALLVPSDDIAAWKTAVRRLLDQPELRRLIAATAQHELETQYTWDARTAHILTQLALEAS